MGKMEPTYVDVICQHTKNGDIIPMRVRVTDEDAPGTGAACSSMRTASTRLTPLSNTV